MRDGVNAATKMVGLDISKYLKFKPWGATKLANGLGSALAVVGIALEAWDSYKEQERQAKFAETISTIVTNLQEQSKEVTRLVDAPDFSDRFFPAFVSLRQQLTAIDTEMSLLQERQVRFKKWYDSGTVIDAEFREINQNDRVKWESVPEFGHDTTIVETVSSVAASEAPGAANAQTKPKSFWSKMLS